MYVLTQMYFLESSFLSISLQLIARHKVRFLVIGHQDRYKHMMTHDVATLQSQSFVRVLFDLAAIFDFDAWASDGRQNYL